MSLQYVIDGYNIIKHSLFTKHAHKKIQDPRIKLQEFIYFNRLCGSRNNKIILVFDGYPDSRYQEAKLGIEEIFSKKESADEKIKIMVAKSQNAKNIVVVSDDKEIRSFVKSYGAKVEGVEDFLASNEKIKENKKEDSFKADLTYTQIHSINNELRHIWLK